MSKFSTLLKNREPELFKRNAIHFGYFKDEMINGINLFNSTEFSSINDQEVKNSYDKTKSSLNYLLVSFLSFGIIGILTVYIN